MSNLIECIPLQMRDNLYEELNQWRTSGERDRWLKKLEEQKQAGRRTTGVPLLSDYSYQQVKTPELINMP